ncbi:MAG TPA: CoA-binding protein [Deltaproteobacteria bacterium]|nr:CoA-binding protein [Deltaproteobacteria bacterium]HOI07045.1 CoA-binding protein [Deltaproteobacteria bacterium]
MKNTPFCTSLFEPRTVVFIGASTNPSKWGFNILHHIIKGGFEGNLYPVNPQGGTWFGRPVYKNLGEVPRPVDLAIIVVPKERVPDTLRECIDAGIPAAVIITAGFGETGAEGKALEQEVLSIAHAGNIRIVGPNTMGVYSAYPFRMQAIMTSAAFKPGPVAVVTQSGNLGTSISYRFLRRGIGISRLISSGNEADLTIEDYLEYLETDEKTKIICLYIEGVRQGSRFIETIRRISAVKPVILLKGGTGTCGAEAAMSHTGAMAGSFAVFRSMCCQANAILVDTIDEMVDIAGLMLSQPEVMGKRVGIVTQGGGWGVISADLCEMAGLEIPPLDERVIGMLDAFLPEFWSRRNPVDLVAPGRVSMITDSIEALLKYTDMDAILLLGLGYMTSRARNWMSSPVLPGETMEPHAKKMIAGEMELLDLLVQQIRHFNKPILPVIDLVGFDMPGEGNIAKHLDSMGIMAYSSPEQAVRALAKAVSYYRKRRTGALRD